MNKRLIPIAILGLLLSGLPLVGADSISATATVSSSLSATFHYTSVDFGSLTIGSTDNPALGQSTGIYNVTVDTNDEFNVTVSGTDFSDGTYTIPISNLVMDTDTAPASLNVTNGIALSTSGQVIDSFLPATTTDHFHGFWLDIPADQHAGDYTSTVTITYSVA